MTVNLGEPTFGEEEIEAVREVLASGWVAGQGPRGKAFERAFADMVGAPDAVAVNNCTAGLHLALLSFEVGPGDEVIVSDYTYPATGHSVLFTGARPVFADVCADTGCIDSDLVEDLITPATRGIIAVDAAGQCADFTELRAVADRHGLFLIEDAACSAGAEYQGKPSGHPSLADLATFSLHGRKGITCGEGGVVTGGDGDRLARIRMQSSFGVQPALERQGSDQLPIPSFGMLGFNYKLSDIAAAIAEVQLRRLPDLLTARRRAAAHYEELFADYEPVRTPTTRPDRTHTYQSYNLTLDPSVDRGAVAMSLRAQGLGANIGTYASHVQPVYGDVRPCPVSKMLFDRHLSIPMHANLSDDDIELVASAVKAAIDKSPTRKETGE
jgi:perosamine synthetase